MNREDARIAAVLSAVSMYVDQEAETQQKAAPSAPVFFASGVSPWRLFGRQELMRARRPLRLRRSRA